MSLRIFILEDEIDRLPRSEILPALEGHTVTVAKSFPEAKEKYQGPYDLLLLDHDMEGFYEMNKDYPNTGYQFVKWLTDDLPPTEDWIGGEAKPHIIIHSHNPQGRRLMRLLLEEYGFNVEEYPFSGRYVEQLKTVLKDRDKI